MNASYKKEIMMASFAQFIAQSIATMTKLIALDKETKWDVLNQTNALLEQ